MDYFLYGNNPNDFCYNEHSSSSNGMKLEEKKKKKKKGKKISGSKEVKLSTDPQSVAARERRHRISERFKILQSLVPGGTKMDTVSMLEEAIHYVKFLKTQIWWLNHQPFDHDRVSDHNIDHDPTTLMPLGINNSDEQQLMIMNEHEKVCLQATAHHDQIPQAGFPADYWSQLCEIDQNMHFGIGASIN